MKKCTSTVLITGAGTVTCQSVIKGLRIQDEIKCAIITVDASTNVAGRYFSDRFFRVPRANDPAFVPALLQLCRDFEVDLLIPIVDYEFLPLSMAKHLFSSIGCLVAVPSPEVIRTTNDKLVTYRFFKQHGFSTPKTWSAREAQEQIHVLPYPVFLKPALDGRSSLDCYKVDDPDELQKYLERVPEALVQEYIEGTEYTADVVADFESTVLGLAVRQRVETKGGVSYKGVTVHDAELEAEVERMIPLLGLTGPANIQAFRSQGQLFFNEINPRFSGALALSVAAGLNSPVLLLKLALGLGRDTGVQYAQPGITMLRYWNEIFLDPMGQPIYPEYHLNPSLCHHEEVAGGGIRGT